MEPLEPERQRGALRGGPARVSEQRARNRLRVDYREAPVIELDPLGEELCAEPVPVAGNRINA